MAEEKSFDEMLKEIEALKSKQSSSTPAVWAAGQKVRLNSNARARLAKGRGREWDENEVGEIIGFDPRSQRPQVMWTSSVEYVPPSCLEAAP